MRLAILLAVIALAASYAINNVTPVAACYCGLSPERLMTTEGIPSLVADADTIVVGEVVEVIPGAGFLAERTRDLDSRVEVKRYLKGTGPKLITVDDPPDVGSCGFTTDAALHQRYLFFLQSKNDRLETHLCAGNALLTNSSLTSAEISQYVADVEFVTGPGQAPQAHDPPREAMWLAAALIPLAFLAAATLAPGMRR